MPRPLLPAALRLPILALPALFLAAPATAAPAAAARWTPLGPNGGGILCLAGDRAGRALYAGTTGGAYRSVDGGSHWTLLAGGIGRQPVAALAVEPLRPAVVYAGTAEQGVWKSLDGGASWAPANRGLPSRAVRTVAIDPFHPGVVYLGLADRPGPWKSADGGVSWHAADAGLPPDAVSSLALDPARPGLVYASFELYGLFASADGGATWARLATSFQRIVRVAVAPDGSALYAVSLPGHEPVTSLFRSLDGGLTWTDVTPSPVPVPVLDYPLALGPGGLVYTQGFASADRGDHWTPAAVPDGPFAALLAAPGAPRTVYGASGTGVYRSADGGASWIAASRGIQATAIGALAVDPRSGAVLVGVDGLGLLRSRQSPGSWRQLLAETPGFVVVDPSRPATFYAGLNGSARELANRIARSTDGGATWRELPLDDRCMDLADLAVDPTDPALLYAGGQPDEVDHTCIDGPPVTYRSTDGGETWRRMQLPSLLRIAVDPFDPRRVYAVAGNGVAGVYRSADRGATWKLVTSGLGASEVFDLAVDPSTPGRLYASNGQGIYRSDDGARSWRLLNGQVRGAVRVDPARPLTLYLDDERVGIFRSLDGGATWSSLADGQLAPSLIGPLVVDPTRPGTLYVGTGGAGLYRVEVAAP
jgi:photosystem II stability/assembly factor-like uncharacterized protein